jgi:hypothetical protein
VRGIATVGDDVIVAGSDGILRVPLGGAPHQTIVSAQGASAVAVIGPNVLFNALHADGAVDPQAKQPNTTLLFAVPLAGGKATIAQAQVSLDGPWASDGVSLFFRSGVNVAKWTPFDAAPTELPTSGKAGVNSIAVYGDDIYVAVIDITIGNPKNGAIERLRKSGGLATRIVRDIGHPHNVVADASGLYWVEDPPTGTFGTSHIAHANHDGTVVTTFSPHGSTQMVLTTDSLYYEGSDIGRIPKRGGPDTKIATAHGPDFLTITGSNLVWVDDVQRSLSDTTPMSVRTACIDGI